MKNIYRDFLKRLIDIGFSSCALLFLAPFFILLCFFIKFDSPGPVIFSQIRVGKNGQKFRIYKFRTMFQNAEKMKFFLQDKNEMDGVIFKIKDDPRVTFIGRFLRKSSIDELPQLWNVLKGDMSLVGPRPALPEEVLQYSEKSFKRLKVKPGCSGLWQISGRSNLSFDTMIDLDLKYIDRISFKYDFIIMIKTIMVIISGKGAY